MTVHIAGNKAAVAIDDLRIQIRVGIIQLIAIAISSNKTQTESACAFLQSEEIALIRYIECTHVIAIAQDLTSLTIESLLFCLVDDSKILIGYVFRTTSQTLVDSIIFHILFRMIHHIKDSLGITLTKGAITCSRKMPGIGTITGNTLSRHHMPGRNDLGYFSNHMIMPRTAATHVLILSLSDKDVYIGRFET